MSPAGLSVKGGGEKTRPRLLPDVNYEPAGQRKELKRRRHPGISFKGETLNAGHGGVFPDIR